MQKKQYRCQVIYKYYLKMQSHYDIFITKERIIDILYLNLLVTVTSKRGVVSSQGLGLLT